MSIKVECDGNCGKVSPTSSREYIANKWTTILVDKEGAGSWRKYRFCQDCIHHANLALWIADPLRGERVSFVRYD